MRRQRCSANTSPSSPPVTAASGTSPGGSSTNIGTRASTFGTVTPVAVSNSSRHATA